MGRRSTLAWLIAVIAGVLMVVPALASAQEQGSTDADLELTDEVTGDEPTTTEDPAAETPPADPPAAPAEPVEPAPVEETEPAAEPADAGFDGSADTSKAAAPEASSEPAPAPAAAPEPAEVAAVEAESTDTPGNDGGGDATAGRRVASGGGDVKATIRSSESKPGVCYARGGAGEVHDFPDDGSCVQSQFEGGLPTEPGGDTPDLTINAPTGTISFDIWEDPEGTVNFTVLSGGPFTGAFYIKGGPLHNQCEFTAVTSGFCLVPNNNSGNQAGFSHLDVCVGENPPPPPPPEIPPTTEETPPREEDTPPEDEVLTEEEREQQQQQQEEEEAQPPTAVPTAVAATPEEALPFTGLDTGWLLALSLALLGAGVALRRQAS